MILLGLLWLWLLFRCCCCGLLRGAVAVLLLVVVEVVAVLVGCCCCWPLSLLSDVVVLVTCTQIVTHRPAHRLSLKSGGHP